MKRFGCCAAAGMGGGRKKRCVCVRWPCCPRCCRQGPDSSPSRGRTEHRHGLVQVKKFSRTRL